MRECVWAQESAHDVCAAEPPRSPARPAPASCSPRCDASRIPNARSHPPVRSHSRTPGRAHTPAAAHPTLHFGFSPSRGAHQGPRLPQRPSCSTLPGPTAPHVPRRSQRTPRGRPRSTGVPCPAVAALATPAGAQLPGSCGFPHTPAHSRVLSILLVAALVFHLSLTSPRPLPLPPLLPCRRPFPRPPPHCPALPLTFSASHRAPPAVR